MNNGNLKHIFRDLEEEYITSISNYTLKELGEAYGHPLNNLTDLLDITNLPYYDGIWFLLQKDDFLNLPIIAHCFDGRHDLFLIEKYPCEKIPSLEYRAITLDSAAGECALAFCIYIPENKVADSPYKTVRDIIPLINKTCG